MSYIKDALKTNEESINHSKMTQFLNVCHAPDKSNEFNLKDLVSKNITSRLEDIGEIKAKIKEVMDMEIFDKLSKHDHIWNNEELKEKDYDILWDMRSYFLIIQGHLEDIQDILYRE